MLHQALLLQGAGASLAASYSHRCPKTTKATCACFSDVNICCNFNDDYDNITGYCPNQRVDRLKYMEDRIRLVSENNLIDRLYSESIPSLKARIGCLTFHFTANWGKILGYALKFQEAKSTFPGYEDTFFLLEHILDSGGLIANEAGAGDISRFQLMAMLLSFFEVSSRIQRNSFYCLHSPLESQRGPEPSQSEGE